MKGTKDATSVVKQMISVVSCMAKSKCMAIRAKTDAMRAQLMVTAFTVMSKKRKFSLGALSGKLNGIFHHDDNDRNNVDDHYEEDDSSMAIVLYSNKSGPPAPSSSKVIEYDYNENDDEKYPDLRHSLFDEEDEKELVDLLGEDTDSSAIDQVKKSKENGENFNLEDEIDEVADMFITKFHKRMRLQKLLSFKRQQQMMERSTGAT